jgi:rubrerythrin
MNKVTKDHTGAYAYNTDVWICNTCGLNCEAK